MVTEIEVIESLDFEPDFECVWVVRGCKTKAVWFLKATCCDNGGTFCDRHKIHEINLHASSRAPLCPKCRATDFKIIATPIA